MNLAKSFHLSRAVPKLYYALFALIFTGVGSFGFLYSLNSFAATNGSLSLSPASATASVGDSFTVTITEDSSTTPVNAVEADLTFPIDKLQFISIDSSSSAFGIQAAANGNNSTGSVTIVRGVNAGSAGITNSQQVAKVTFKALAPGSATISFANSSALVESNTNTDILSTKNSGTYTLQDTTVPPGDTTAPSTPTSLTASAGAYNKVDLTWTASNDNVGVTGYYINRNGTTIAQTTAVTSYSDTTVLPATSYSYQIVAFDAASNESGFSNTSTVTTPDEPDSTPPTAPANLVATAVSNTQINLSWNDSSDNIGVTGYDVYRGNNLVATVATTSFGDTGLSASTSYSYSVIARDVAGNSSPASNTATAETKAPPVTNGILKGVVKGKGNKSLAGAIVSLTVNGSRATYTTSSTGNYMIPNLPAGAYSVTYSASGYSNKVVNVVIVGNQTTIQDITLSNRKH
jgi:chitodextrinase